MSEPAKHGYSTKILWTGNRGTGTSGYHAYDRSHVIRSVNKPEIRCSSDPSFLGDRSKYNPEELFLAALSACHMLWHLHLCADAGIIVTAYEDHVTGMMTIHPDGGGHFTEVILRPEVTVTDPGMVDPAIKLHDQAHTLCFIAHSVNFPVIHHPVCHVG